MRIGRSPQILQNKNKPNKHGLRWRCFTNLWIDRECCTQYTGHSSILRACINIKISWNKCMGSISFVSVELMVSVLHTPSNERNSQRINYVIYSILYREIRICTLPFQSTVCSTVARLHRRCHGTRICADKLTDSWAHLGTVWTGCLAWPMRYSTVYGVCVLYDHKVLGLIEQLGLIQVQGICNWTSCRLQFTHDLQEGDQCVCGSPNTCFTDTWWFEKMIETIKVKISI